MVSTEATQSSCTSIGYPLPIFRLSDTLYKSVLGGIATRRHPNAVSATHPVARDKGLETGKSKIDNNRQNLWKVYA